MKLKQNQVSLIALMAVAAIGLYYGWKLFWFLTDDAFIAFRYVSNSVLGIGYTWNPPPFRPIEGYSSFLWVGLLDVVWRWFGVEPPASANYLSLFFSYLTLALIAWAVWRIKWPESWRSLRIWLVAIVFFGCLTNRTFLAWTSSGLETALFNFSFILWMAIALFGDRRRKFWLTGLSAAAVLVYLVRPDGMLILAATAGLAGFQLASLKRSGRTIRSQLVVLLPWLVPVIHLSWRRSFYGEWLPNTYYAKYVAAWPEAGWRYLASFVVEYGLPVWILAALAFLVQRFYFKSREPVLAEASSEAQVSTGVSQPVALSLVLGTVVAHLSYYTFIIGGDHFEYRIYSYLIPFIFVSFLWFLSRLAMTPARGVGLTLLLIMLSWPIPWTHWAETKDLMTERQTRKMFRPIADQFPIVVNSYVEVFDDLQAWLVSHSVGARHQAHKAFWLRQQERYPVRSTEPIDGHPVFAITAVGVAGWQLPRVAIIDALGLNDYVIARQPVDLRGERTMAHDRLPPPGYLESFAVNYGWRADRSFGPVELETDLTSQEIIDNEAYWMAKEVQGLPDIKPPVMTLMRQGEFLARQKDYQAAVPLLAQALAVDENCCAARSLLAACLTQLGRRDSALALVSGTPRAEECSAVSLTRLGSLMIEAGYDLSHSDQTAAGIYFERGEVLLRLALTKEPDQVSALVALASLHVFLDQTDRLVECLVRLETIESMPVGPLVVLVEQLAFKRHWELAARVLAMAERHGLTSSEAARITRAHPRLVR